MHRGEIGEHYINIAKARAGRGRKMKPPKYALTDKELANLWSKCTSLRDQVLIGLLALCGLRSSEAVHLRADWVSKGNINIPPETKCDCLECKKRDGWWRPRSKYAVRKVPIPEFLEPLLMKFLKESPGGLGMIRLEAYFRVKRLAKAAGIPTPFPWSLRATAVRLFFEKAKMPTSKLCKLLGLHPETW